MAPSDYIAAVLVDSPKVFWELQEASGLPQDSSGNSLHITATSGSPQYSRPGPGGTDFGVRFPGGTGFQRSIVSTVTNDFSLEAWIQYEAGGGDGILYNGNSGANGWGMGNFLSTKLSGLAGGVAGQANSAADINTGLWIHTVVVRDSTNSSRWTYYINGSLDTANAGTGNPNTPTGNTNIMLGTGTQFVVAYAAIYETVLSAARVAAHYAAMVLTAPRVSIPQVIQAGGMRW